ncbi:MAG TPA: DUF1629 domain-containing protein [Steroidobacteraceae bacterium]|jgi:hypothetical protein
MYYVLRCLPPLNEKGEALMEIHNCFDVGSIWDWQDGQALTAEERNFPVPIEIEFQPFRGYSGAPVELRDVCIPLMSVRLAEAVAAAGVDNVDFFPAVLRNTVSGQTYDYRAYKIIGMIAAADLQKSEWSSYDGKPVADVSFESLVLDENRPRGLPMFRLAEKASAVVVHERVKQVIEARGIDTIEFVKPEEWVHL